MRSLLIMAALLLTAPAIASEADMALLRDVICKIETQHLSAAEAEDAVGDAGELGVCQILPATARQAGYKGSNRDLLNRTINRRVALDVLLACRNGKRFDAHRIAYCYHGGTSRTYRPRNIWWGYANRAALAFEMARAKARHTRPKDGG